MTFLSTTLSPRDSMTVPSIRMLMSLPCRTGGGIPGAGFSGCTFAGPGDAVGGVGGACAATASDNPQTMAVTPANIS